MPRLAISRSRILIAIGAIVVVALGCQQVLSRSQAILDARHVLPPSRLVATLTPEAEARGGRLIAISACSGCHGTDLTGGPLNAFGTEVHAPNLTLQTPKLSDGDIDRALRAGLRPNGTSELMMPAHAYRGFTDDEVAAIIAGLRALPKKGTDLPGTQPGLLLRAALLAGWVQLETDKVAAARPPLDAGATLQAGRHLAAVACGRCHGSDLGGMRGGAPDMTVRGYYTRAKFHGLIQKGDAIGEGDMALMTQTAQASFSHFTNAEVDAIYDYLDARDGILLARTAAAR